MFAKKYIFLLGLTAVAAQPLEAMSWKTAVAITAGVVTTGAACYWLYNNMTGNSIVQPTPGNVNNVIGETIIVEDYDALIENRELSEDERMSDDSDNEDFREIELHCGAKLEPLYTKLEKELLEYDKNNIIIPADDVYKLLDCTCNTCEFYNDFVTDCFCVKHKNLVLNFLKKNIHYFSALQLKHQECIITFFETGKINLVRNDIKKRFKIILAAAAEFEEDISSPHIFDSNWVIHVLDTWLINDRFYVGTIVGFLYDFESIPFLNPVLKIIRSHDKTKFFCMLWHYYSQAGLLNEYSSPELVNEYNQIALIEGKEQITSEKVEQYKKDAFTFCKNFYDHKEFRNILKCAKICDHRDVVTYLQERSPKKTKHNFKKIMHTNGSVTNNYCDVMIFCAKK